MRLTNILLLASTIGLAAAATACRQPPPVQPLQHVSDSAKLRVKFNSKFAEPSANLAPNEAENVRVILDAERAIVEQLRAAGYDVVDHGKWDVKMSMTVSVSRYRNFDPEYTHAEVTFFDHKDVVVDRIAFDMKQGAAPAAEPKRVANVVVNGVVESKKLSSYADDRHAAKAKSSPPKEPSAQ